MIPITKNMKYFNLLTRESESVMFLQEFQVL